MKSSGKSYPSWDDVRDTLGEKVVASLAASVRPTKADYQEYRDTFPGWVAQHSERGLASWLHDRMWFHCVTALQDVPDVSLLDHEPTREIGVGCTFRIRMKRHHGDGHVSTYPTPTALDFLFQTNVQGVLDGLDEVNLIAGYEWDRIERKIGDPVISLRDGRRIIWKENLMDYEPPADSGTPARPISPAPTPPVIETPGQEQVITSDDDE